MSTCETENQEALQIVENAYSEETAKPLILRALNSLRSIGVKKSILEFFEDGFKLTDDDRFKIFNIDYAPWIRGLCEWYNDPKTAWIILIQGSQTSKTTFEMGVLDYVSKYEQGAVPCLWVQSTDTEAKLFITERLRPFLEDANQIKNWKSEAFRVGNAPVKVGYATNRSSLRSKPARFIFGDEISLWRETIDYVKKRTRSFIGKRKGIFATTPPEGEDHHSWQAAISGNFYQFWVECPHCRHEQPLLFSQLKWTGKQGKDWDLDEVYNSAKYHCCSCDNLFDESKKIDILKTGKLVCVDWQTYQRKEERKTDTKTLQVSALYSVFTPWGQLAVDFLKAKRAGRAELRVFITDELAEIPERSKFYEEDKNEKIEVKELKALIDPQREPGLKSIYELYTAGVDVQHNGELYWTVCGWLSGVTPAFHVVDYGLSRWRDFTGLPNFESFLEDIREYIPSLYLCALDSSYGLDAPDIYNFCNFQGTPFLALKECPLQYIPVRYALVELDSNKQRNAAGQKLMEVNSHMIKDKILAAWKKGAGQEGSFSLHSKTDDIYIQHLLNEKRIEQISRGRKVSFWEPRYGHAPQHWFSSLVYAVACGEEATWLRKRKIIECHEKKQEPEPRKSWLGVGSGWLNNR